MAKRRAKTAKKKKPVVKKIALRPGHVAEVILPPGHVPVVVQEESVVKIAPTKKKGWLDWLLED